MTATKKRTGRPPKPPRPGQKSSLGLKVTAEIKRRIDTEAMRQGRTQSQEAEWRLARSFDRQDLLDEVLTIAYGKQIAALLIVMGSVLRRYAGQPKDGKPPKDDAHWLDDPVVYQQAAHVVAGLAMQFSKHKSVLKPDTLSKWYQEQTVIALIGTLSNLRNSTDERWTRVRENLGELMKNLPTHPEDDQ